MLLNRFLLLIFNSLKAGGKMKFVKNFGETPNESNSQLVFTRQGVKTIECSPEQVQSLKNLLATKHALLLQYQIRSILESNSTLTNKYVIHTSFGNKEAK